LVPVSSDQAPGAPSFGDLFDDPDAPLLPVDRTPAPPATTPATPSAEAATDEAATDEPRAGAGGSDEADASEVEPQDDADVASPTPSTEGGTADDHVADEPSPEEPAARSYAGSGGAAAAAAAASSAPWDGTVDPAISSAPATRVDTGRLYRSAGAEGPATLDAIPAIDPGYVPRRPTTAAAAAAASSVVPEATRGGGRGLTYSGVAVVVISVTVLVAFADALINDRLGILTGVALAASSIYAAVAVRRADIWAAVVMPPLAFLVATLTAGQLTLDASGSLLLREAYMLFRTLAVNAPWILGTTLVCLVIVLVRRARS
jgi:hypothetical protein